MMTGDPAEGAAVCQASGDAELRQSLLVPRAPTRRA